MQTSMSLNIDSRAGTEKLNSSTIGSPLQVEMRDAELDVHGWISFSTDIEHWIEHRVPLDFQNLALAWVISGANFIINGNNKGGIDGNGETWYNWAKDEGNKYGRQVTHTLASSFYVQA